MAIILRTFLALAYVIWLAHRGYQRRRTYWASAEWRAFAKGLGVTLTALVLSMAMAYAVDLGIYEVVSTSRAFGNFWVGLMFVLIIGGVLGLMWQLWWFGNGDPTKPPRFFMKPSRPSPR